MAQVFSELLEVTIIAAPPLSTLSKLDEVRRHKRLTEN